VIAADKASSRSGLARFESLSKSLRALPDIRHGVTDPGERAIASANIDLILDEDSRRVFAIRAAVI